MELFFTLFDDVVRVGTGEASGLQQVHHLRSRRGTTTVNK
jgi:hypothetical protein